MGDAVRALLAAPTTGGVKGLLGDRLWPDCTAVGSTGLAIATSNGLLFARRCVLIADVARG